MGEYTLDRTFPAPPTAVFEYFVDPTLFSTWFRVPGYRTPSERVRIDARPGGAVHAVMVADADGSEVPFSVPFEDLQHPHLVVLHPGPDEVLTIRLTDRDGSTDLSYAYEGTASSPADIAASEVMLDHIAEHVSTGRRAGPA